VSEEQQLAIEATLIVRVIREAQLHTDTKKTRILVATPHRCQKACVEQELSRVLSEHVELRESVTVDTIDRMQGREADIVIVCYTVFDKEKSKSDPELSHIYSLPRINVAITRAQSLCIMLVTPHVLSVSGANLSTGATRRALAHLQAFRDQSEIDEYELDFNAIEPACT